MREVLEKVKKDEFKQAMKLATTYEVGLMAEDIAVFDGYGLKDFPQVYVTIRQVAALIRWQAVRFDGTLDSQEISDLGWVARRKFVVIG